MGAYESLHYVIGGGRVRVSVLGEHVGSSQDWGG